MLRWDHCLSKSYLTPNPINNSFKSNINLESKIKQIYVDFKFAISAQAKIK